MVGDLGYLNQLEESLPHICYKTKNADIRIPDWGRSFQLIGARVASRADAGHRTCVAIVVPTRELAAVLVASGVVFGRATVPADNVLPEHFQALCSLPSGTQIWLLEEKRRLKGIICGSEKINGDTWIRIQVSTRDNGYLLLNELNSRKIELGEWDGRLPDEPKGEKIQADLGFLQSSFGQFDIRDFYKRSHLDALIVGSFARLRAEIIHTKLSAPLPNGRYVAGEFQELLKVRQFSSKSPYRTDIQCGSKRDITSRRLNKDSVCIFDGASYYIKMRTELNAIATIVILDRTAPGFEEAIEILNQSYSSRLADIPEILSGLYFPWSVEVVAYEGTA